MVKYCDEKVKNELTKWTEEGDGERRKRGEKRPHKLHWDEGWDPWRGWSPTLGPSLHISLAPHDNEQGTILHLHTVSASVSVPVHVRRAPARRLGTLREQSGGRALLAHHAFAIESYRAWRGNEVRQFWVSVVVAGSSEEGRITCFGRFCFELGDREDGVKRERTLFSVSVRLTWQKFLFYFIERWSGNL